MNYELFLSTFALIFIAELPDKTIFATLILATRNKPLPIFFGVCAAFIVQSAVAIIFGKFLSLLPYSVTQVGAGLLFIIFAIVMLRKKDEEEKNNEGASPMDQGFWKPFLNAFTVIFIAEWGDLTQLATATLVAREKQPLTIFVAATLALCTATGLAVIVGHKAKSKINPKILQKVAAFLFLAVGVWMISKAYQGTVLPR